MENRKSDIVKLSKEFGKVIQSWLDKEEIKAVNEKNALYKATGDEGICATHNYCDANMAMDEAFENAFGYSPFENGIDDSVELWNGAWSMAVANCFYVSRSISR